MRVLWILNSPIGIASKYLSNVHSQSGTWIDASLDALLRYDRNCQIAIAAYNSLEQKYVVSAQLQIYGLGEKAIIGKRIKAYGIERIIDEFKPELIQIWGTEFSFGINVVNCARKNKIPVVFYIQGVISAISSYKYGNIGLLNLIKHAGVLGPIKGFKVFCEHRMFMKQSLIECEMISKSDGIICDNDWCKAHLGLYATNIYYHVTPINNVFMRRQWKIPNSYKKTIMTVGGTNSGKGQHKLLEALIYVKKVFPSIKVIIPGNMRFGWKENPYVSYLKWFIKKNHLEDNVEFCGQLTSQQMADRLMEADVFVNPSYIENISTSLREAMYLGLPCITSQVGSLHEVVMHGYNGLVYRYEESKVLAFEIIDILTNTAKAQFLGNNAYVSIRERYPQERTGEILNKIYKQVIENYE